MKEYRRFTSILLSLVLTTSVLATDLTLRYEQPSQTWMGSLPLGNGRLGAMVFGGIDKETIAISEVTLWSGQPDPDCNNMLGPDRLREIRSAFLGGDYKLGNEMGWRSMNGHGRSFGTNLPLGAIIVEMNGHDGPATSNTFPGRRFSDRGGAASNQLSEIRIAAGRFRFDMDNRRV